MPNNLTAIVITMLALSACSGSANMIRKDRTGGRVEVAGAYVPAMMNARALMVEHCNGRFQATELDRAVEFRCRGSAAPERGRGQNALFFGAFAP